MSDKELMQYLFNITSEQDLSVFGFSGFCKTEDNVMKGRTLYYRKTKKSKWQAVSRVDLVQLLTIAE